MNSTITAFDSIENGLKSNQDFVYIKKGIESCAALPFERLQGIICDVGDRHPKLSGFPPELIKYIDMAIYSPNISFDSNASIVYFSPNGYDTKEHVLTIIKLFNMLSSKDLVIYTSQKIYDQVRCFCNENISFRTYTDPNKTKISAGMLITYGYCTRKCIQERIPTIVIGPYGLGGWVTPENIDYLLKDNFKGRPGGAFEEIVPLEILVDEFMEIKENEKSLANLLHENVSILKDYMNELHIGKLDEIMIDLQTVYSKLKNVGQRPFLLAKLSSNFSIKENGTQKIVFRKTINDVLFSVPEDELPLLEDLNNMKSCRFLKEKYKMNEEEFWEMMTQLWERKAIVFYNEVSQEG